MDKIINYFGQKIHNITVTTDYNISMLCKLIDGEPEEDDDVNNPELINSFAMFHEIKNNFKLAEKYYLMAINQNYVLSMHNLGKMYFISKNNGESDSIKYFFAEKYFMMAIKNNYIRSMYYLAALYQKQKKYDLAEQYYLTAINNDTNTKKTGRALAMHNHNLAGIYARQKKYDLAEKYYLAAMENQPDEDCVAKSKNNLEKCKKEYELTERRFLAAAKNGHVDSINNLIELYIKNNRYNSLLMLYKKYNANINHIVKEILRGQIPITDDIIKLLHHFDIFNEQAYLTNCFDFKMVCIFNIFKQINIIPKVMNRSNYQTYKLVIDHVMPNIKKSIFNICKNVIISICKKIFDN